MPRGLKPSVLGSREDKAGEQRRPGAGVGGQARQGPALGATGHHGGWRGTSAEGPGRTGTQRSRRPATVPAPRSSHSHCPVGDAGTGAPARLASP